MVGANTVPAGTLKEVSKWGSDTRRVSYRDTVNLYPDSHVRRPLAEAMYHCT